MALIDQERAQKFCQQRDLSTDNQNVLKDIINSISQAIRDYCGHSIEEETLTEYYDGHGERLLILNNYPIVSVTSVTRYKDDTARTQVVVASGEYRIDSVSGELIMDPINYVDSAVWVKGELNYKIVFKSGYATANIPESLKHACEVWVSIAFQKSLQKLNAVSSTSIGDQEITYVDDPIPKSVKALLDPYRRPY